MEYLFESCVDPEMTMSEDLRIFGSRSNLLRVYTWSRPALTIGRHQREDEFDLDELSRSKTPIIKRPTGGRAIYHGGDLTFSLFLEEGSLFTTLSLRGAQEMLSRSLCGFFKDLQIEANPGGSSGVKSPLCYSSIAPGEVVVDEKKILALALYRGDVGLMVQGSIPLDNSFRDAVYFEKGRSLTKISKMNALQRTTLSLYEVLQKLPPVEAIGETLYKNLKTIS